MRSAVKQTARIAPLNVKSAAAILLKLNQKFTNDYQTNTVREYTCSKLTVSNPYLPLHIESDDVHEDITEYEYTHTEKVKNLEKCSSYWGTDSLLANILKFYN